MSQSIPRHHACIAGVYEQLFIESSVRAKAKAALDGVRRQFKRVGGQAALYNTIVTSIETLKRLDPANVIRDLQITNMSLQSKSLSLREILMIPFNDEGERHCFAGDTLFMTKDTLSYMTAIFPLMIDSKKVGYGHIKETGQTYHYDQSFAMIVGMALILSAAYVIAGTPQHVTNQVMIPLPEGVFYKGSMTRNDCKGGRELGIFRANSFERSRLRTKETKRFMSEGDGLMSYFVELESVRATEIRDEVTLMRYTALHALFQHSNTNGFFTQLALNYINEDMTPLTEQEEQIRDNIVHGLVDIMRDEQFWPKYSFKS